MCSETTKLLTLASQGDAAAAEQLMPQVYDSLRDLAGRFMAGGVAGDINTIQPTALVNEAFLRLVAKDAADFNSRTHFFAVAAKAMRQILIDHLRGRQRAKRGGDQRRVSLTGISHREALDQTDLLTLDEALSRLAEVDARAARVVELRFFAGMTDKEIAAALDVTDRTVRNDWSMARAWLRSSLGARGDLLK